MTDRSQRKRIDVPCDSGDLHRLETLVSVLPIGRGSLVRQCVRIGLKEIEQDPSRFDELCRGALPGAGALSMPSDPDFE